MIISKMIIENFRQFIGKQEITFSTDKNKNVTVVMGDNGAGKSTLENAFVWGLYGIHNFKDKNLLNKEVEYKLGIDYNTAVTRVKIFFENNDKKYEIERKIIYKKNSSKLVGSEMVNLDKKNHLGDYVQVPEISIDITLRDILPKELSNFFFFDGEHLDSMSQDLLSKKKSSDFKDAVRGLVGLKGLEEALKHLGNENSRGKNTVIGRITDEIDSKAGSNIIECSEKIQKLEIHKAANEKALESAEMAVEQFNSAKNSIQRELESMENDIKRRERYEKLGKDRVKYESQEKLLKEKFFREFSTNIGTFYGKGLYAKALAEIEDAGKLDGGIPGLHKKAIDTILSRNECICGNKFKHGDECYKRLKELVYIIPPYSLGTMIREFSSQIKTATRSIENFQKDMHDQIQIINDYHERVRRCDNERLELEGNLSDQNKAKALQNRRLQADYDLRKANDDIRQISEQLGGIKRDLKREKQNYDMLVAKDSRSKENLKYKNYAVALSNSIMESYSKKEIETKNELQDTINRIFNSIYDGGIHIDVSDKYNITTRIINTVFSGDELERNTAQNYAIIFAFITGIIELARKNNDNSREGYPMVMDAPLSSFDKTRIKKICENIPDIAEQVIIFIKDTDGDIAEKYLENKIGKKYYLRIDKQTSSKIIER